MHIVLLGWSSTSVITWSRVGPVKLTANSLAYIFYNIYVTFNFSLILNMIKQAPRECNIDSLYFSVKDSAYCRERCNLLTICMCVSFIWRPLISKINTKSQFSFSSYSQIFCTYSPWILFQSGKFLNKDLQYLVYLACNHVGKGYKAQVVLIWIF